MTVRELLLSASTDCWAGRNTTATPDHLQCALTDITAPFGESLFGVLAGGFIVLAVWQAGDGDLVVPGLVALALGGILTPILPADYANLAKVIMFTGLVAAGLAVANRFVMDSGI